MINPSITEEPIIKQLGKRANLDWMNDVKKIHESYSFSDQLPDEGIVYEDED